MVSVSLILKSIKLNQMQRGSLRFEPFCISIVRSVRSFGECSRVLLRATKPLVASSHVCMCLPCGPTFQSARNARMPSADVPRSPILNFSLFLSVLLAFDHMSASSSVRKFVPCPWLNLCTTDFVCRPPNYIAILIVMNHRGLVGSKPPVPLARAANGTLAVDSTMLIPRIFEET